MRSDLCRRRLVNASACRDRRSVNYLDHSHRSSGIKDETVRGKAQPDSHSLRVVHPWLPQTRQNAGCLESPYGRPLSMLTRTRSNSFVVKGAFTRAVQFAGRSTGQGDNKALIASVPRVLDHRLPHRHSCARSTSPADKGFRSTYRNRPSSWSSLCTGKLLNLP
jgi:hypothetical protein